MKSKKEEVLRQLKIVRKAKNISYQDIVDGTEALGMAVSLSSVKRVFAENSVACDFRYDTTLRPIVRFVMGVDGDVEDLKTIEEAKANVEGLAAVVDYKDALIAKLETELDRVHDDHRRAIEHLEADEERKLLYLKSELDSARAAVSAAETKLGIWRAAAFMSSSFFIVCLLSVIIYMVFGHRV